MSIVYLIPVGPRRWDAFDSRCQRIGLIRGSGESFRWVWSSPGDERTVAGPSQTLDEARDWIRWAEQGDLQ